MVASSPHVVIVGASHAGGALAAMLRQYGQHGPITLLGAEPTPPYQRPPLSKAWLKGEATAESLALKPLAFCAKNQITFGPKTIVTAIDRAERRLHLLDASYVAYDVAVLATGLRPKRLSVPGADLEGVFTLRSIDDAEALKAALRPGRAITIIG